MSGIATKQRIMQGVEKKREIRPRQRRTESHFEMTCVCGSAQVSHDANFLCSSCGRRIKIEWPNNGPELKTKGLLRGI
jgi:transcription elongation factor Elf1